MNYVYRFFAWLGSLFASSPVAAVEPAKISPSQRTLSKGMKGEDVTNLQLRLKQLGFYALTIDGDFGSKTEGSVKRFQSSRSLTPDGVVGPVTRNALGLVIEPTPPVRPEPNELVTPPWMAEALKHKGQNENNDAYNKMMTPKWKLFGFSLPSIRGSSNAWCGLFVAVTLSAAGYDIQKNGSLARHWSNYGAAIDYKVNGAPRGAIVHINHVKCGNSSSNHVAYLHGNCTAEDLTRKGATFDLYGGNQADQAKVSTYAITEICAMRWPVKSSQPHPGKITQSINCTSGSKGSESTR